MSTKTTLQDLQQDSRNANKGTAKGQKAIVNSVQRSGALSRALQIAWPDASFKAVQVGATPDVGRATLYKAPERFEVDAKGPVPFPSCRNYDAKAWQFVARYAKTGALFWNVAA